MTHFSPLDIICRELYAGCTPKQTSAGTSSVAPNIHWAQNSISIVLNCSLGYGGYSSHSVGQHRFTAICLLRRYQEHPQVLHIATSVTPKCSQRQWRLLPLVSDRPGSWTRWCEIRKRKKLGQIYWAWGRWRWHRWWQHSRQEHGGQWLCPKEEKGKQIEKCSFSAAYQFQLQYYSTN